MSKCLEGCPKNRQKYPTDMDGSGSGDFESTLQPQHSSGTTLASIIEGSAVSENECLTWMSEVPCIFPFKTYDGMEHDHCISQIPKKFDHWKERHQGYCAMEVDDKGFASDYEPCDPKNDNCIFQIAETGTDSITEESSGDENYEESEDGSGSNPKAIGRKSDIDLKSDGLKKATDLESVEELELETQELETVEEFMEDTTIGRKANDLKKAFVEKLKPKTDLDSKESEFVEELEPEMEELETGEEYVEDTTIDGKPDLDSKESDFVEELEPEMEESETGEDTTIGRKANDLKKAFVEKLKPKMEELETEEEYVEDTTINGKTDLNSKESEFVEELEPEMEELETGEEYVEDTTIDGKIEVDSKRSESVEELEPEMEELEPGEEYVEDTTIDSNAGLNSKESESVEEIAHTVELEPAEDYTEETTISDENQSTK